MPELALLVIGAMVTAVAILACVLVGRAEAADARFRQGQTSIARSTPAPSPPQVPVPPQPESTPRTR